MTDAQKEALGWMRANPNQPAILHVQVGGALVRSGDAIKDDTKGHGPLMGSYRLKAGV